MNICVYGAASNTIDHKYLAAAEQLGRSLVKRGYGLVYGAGGLGMMGAVARGAYEAKGSIIGIVPNFFIDGGILFEHCTELIRTETMRERKRRMEELSEAFIITPGGVGTFDEFFEILTLRSLHRHSKPICVYNVSGYYDDMLAMLDKAVEAHFISRECREMIACFTDEDEMLDYIAKQIS